MQELLLVAVTAGLRPHTRVRVTSHAGQREGGVGPAIRVKDASSHALETVKSYMYIMLIKCHAHLHITCDGVRDKLYGCDQKTPGQEQPCCELIERKMRSS